MKEKKSSKCRRLVKCGQQMFSVAFAAMKTCFVEVGK
jgi:hypothetical protein